MKTLRIIFALVITVVVFSSCSKEGDEVIAPAIGPDLSYLETEFVVEFYSTGNSELPELKWNGDVGSISPSIYISGINVDESNGTIQWKKYMPLGINEFQVVAINSNGQTAVPIKINNQFQGDFFGGFNTNPASTTTTFNAYGLNFLPDGTILVNNDGATASGTWSRDGNEIKATYTYDVYMDTYTIVADLNYNNSKAELTGFFYNGENSSPGTEQGYIELALQ